MAYVEPMDVRAGKALHAGREGALGRLRERCPANAIILYDTEEALGGDGPEHVVP